MSFTTVVPLAFTFSDGHQTHTKDHAIGFTFAFATGATGEITSWLVDTFDFSGTVFTASGAPATHTADLGMLILHSGGHGRNEGAPGSWAIVAAAPDTGSTLSLMTLTFMALGVAARQCKRAAVLA